MDGKQWEIKSPCGQSKRTIENNLRKAQKQSGYIIFDLRRIVIDENQAIAKIKQEMVQQRGGKIKCVLVITKEYKILDFWR